MFFSGVRWPGCNNVHSPPSNVKVKNVWSNKPTSSPCFQGVSRGTFFLTVSDADTFRTWVQVKVKGKVKVTLVQALRLCTGRTTYRGSRGIALPFRDHGIRRG